MAKAARIAEVRAEHLLTELLSAQGWDLRRPPAGEVLRQQEYRDYPHLLDALRGRSKAKGTGDGLPEAILVDRLSLQPLAVIEAKASVDDLETAITEVTTVYGQALVELGYSPLAVALAGVSEDDFAVRVYKWGGGRWLPITYEKEPISWIPNRSDIDRLRAKGAPLELRPTVPSPEVLAARAAEINGLLRESGIKDEFRPAVVAAIMLALWQSKGNIRKDPEYILADINQACARAFWAKPELAVSLRVDVANETLAIKARRIVAILERLNVTVLTAEHDYLGQLYEEFFRYTGGNTIGQYFTPRHVANFMADLVDVSASDVVLDPACGTGGFLIAAMNNVMTHGKLSRSAVVKLVKKQLIGFDKEPVTAALCIANMILRGDGSTGVHKGDAFTSPKFPKAQANVVLMNPPFPHKKTDTPPERFIERALEGLQQRGRMAVIVPRSMLAKRDKAKWRSKILTQNRLDGVIVLPDELFMPYASSYTAVLLMTRGASHPPDHSVFFARVENDGFRLRKGVRVARTGDELPKALDAYKRRLTTPGFSGWTKLDSKAGWDPGYYIPPRPLSEEEVAAEAGALVRSRAAFVVKHALELEASLAAIDAGQLTASDYRKRKGGAPSLLKLGATIGEHFEIFYGQKSLHSKERLSPGRALVISSSGAENGSYGFFDFADLIEPPFITVPSTGSIGQAHVQEWPCGVTDDCLLLFPMENVPHELLYVAAAVIRRERWRFNYGMKITPMRIARFPLPFDEVMLARVREHLEGAERIEKLALSDAEDATDAEVARAVLADPKGQGRPVMGDELRQRLKRCLT